MPKWMATIDKTTPPAAFGLAAVLSGANPRTAAGRGRRRCDLHAVTIPSGISAENQFCLQQGSERSLPIVATLLPSRRMIGDRCRQLRNIDPVHGWRWTVLNGVPTATDPKGVQLQGGATAPDPAAYGLSPPLFQRLTAYAARGRIFPAAEVISATPGQPLDAGAWLGARRRGHGGDLIRKRSQVQVLVPPPPRSSRFGGVAVHVWTLPCRRDRRRPGPGKMHPRVSAETPRAIAYRASDVWGWPRLTCGQN
jgi:hypothetical protein